MRVSALDVIRRTLLAAAAAALAVLPGCSLLSRSGTGISFATEPPGARVIVDRKDSGFVTPCRLTLARERHAVDLELAGYATANLRIDRDLRVEVVLWRDMYVREGVWRFPLWLNLEDGLEPVKVRPTLSPGHVFVRLERAPARSEGASAAIPSSRVRAANP